LTPADPLATAFAADPAQLERWNTRYSTEGYLFGTAPNAFLASQRVRLVPGKRALCIADGEGRNSVWLVRQGLHVTAFDFSPVAIAKAHALAHEAGVSVDYRRSDIFEWDWSAAQYDIVAAIFFQFASPPQRVVIFAGLQRALAPGGLLMLQGYRPEQLVYRTGGPDKVENLYTEALLRESFAALEILHLASHDDAVDEGSGHKGMSALIDMVARRPLAQS